MAIVGTFYTIIYDDEDEEYWVPFVVPKARGGGSLLVPC